MLMGRIDGGPMESITKNRQSLPALRAMIERAYGVSRVPNGDDWVTELGHGWFNVAYRVRLRDGAQVVLKVAPPAGVEVLTYERGAMATELAAIKLIRQHTSVPVPTVHFADYSHELCDADYFFMEFVDGDNFGQIKESLPARERTCHNEALGAVTRELNAIRGTAFGPLEGPGAATWRERFGTMFSDILDDGRRRAVDLGWDYAAVEQVLADHADVLDEVTEPRFVEWDLWDNNAMIRDGRIVCVIDHERAFYGDPLIEAGFTPFEMPVFGDSAAAFMRGYGKTSFTPGELVRRRLYTLYLTLIMVVETRYRDHPDALGFARERLDEVMALFGRTR
jgi:aminoglycoside phosphotransferase (APT) family kinase protein